MRCKKAAVEVQFNWIFILVAGALILLFFGMVISKQKAATETKISVSFVSSLQSIITGSSVAPKAASIRTLPKTAVEFGCDAFTVGDLRQPIGKNIVFSPNLLNGRKLVTRSWDWNVPFHVTNFLYLTVPEVRYVFVWDGNDGSNSGKLKKLLDDALPPETIKGEPAMNREFKKGSEIGSLEDQNDYKMRFVFLTESVYDAYKGSIPSARFGSLGEDFTALVIKPDSPNQLENGKLDFYIYTGGSFGTAIPSQYIGTASLLGAIYSEEKETYDCIMRKAFERAEVVADVYHKRSTELKSEYRTQISGDYCESTFGRAENAVLPIISLSRELSSSNPSIQFPSDSTLTTLKVRVQDLKTLNTQARASCASIY